MERLKNFQVAAYVYAYTLDRLSDEEIRRGLDYFLQYIDLRKVYLENHRANTDISKERMRHYKELFAEYGLQVSSGITSTVLVNEIRKPAIYDTFCYSDPAHREKYLNIVLSETERLNKLTGSLLTLNSFDANGTMLELTDFDFLIIAKNTIASFEGQCNAKNIKIRLNHENSAYMVHADQMKIQQVIYNLIDNAIKFSRNDSEIIINVYNKNGKVFVAVKDFGVGISSENQLKIWERFYKVDDSRGKDKKGTGLGLAIVKEIITAHNENINVISTEGVGTQFVFSLLKGKG